MFAILAFGDSIVQGRKAPASRGWVQLLKEDFEYRGDHHYVFNLGVPGDTSFTLLKRLAAESQARLHHRREGDRIVLLIGVGTNDAKCVGSPDIHETDPAHFRKNLHELIGQARTFTDRVALIGLLPVDESKVSPYGDTWFTNARQGEYNTIIKEVCGWEKTLFIDPSGRWQQDDHLRFLEDGLHPNGIGHRRLYEQIHGALTKHGILKED
ncbi:MAG: hypothetical protein GXP63_05060 [DPANN group archaeon]|nr:hypothetical protein [DPANN group archaeon]